MAHTEREPRALNAILAQRRQRRRLGLIAILSALALGVLTVWWFSLTPPAPPPPIATEQAPPPPPTRELTPPPEPHRVKMVEEVVVAETEVPPPAILPSLNSSDAPVRAAAYLITGSAVLANFLAGEALIRRFVTAVDNIAEGNSPTAPLNALRPRNSYRANWQQDSVTPDPANWQRYNAIGLAVSTLDTEAAVDLYRAWQPRIDEAYRELGYPDRNFSGVLQEALGELLSVPIIEGLPALTPDGIGYAYLDPELEALSPAQKQLLRMGPENAKRVQAKLREFARGLEIPPGSLPRPTSYLVDSDNRAN